MKFLVTKELSHVALLKNLMIGVSFTLLFYLGLDVVLHGYVLGTDIVSITHTLYGNEEDFIEPILIDSLVLQVHIDLFMSLFSLMILASMYIRLYSEKKHTKWFAHSVFILGLLAPLLLLLAYFTSTTVVAFWAVSFFVGHLLAMFMALSIIKKLLSK